MSEIKKDIYDKLTPERKQLVDMVMRNLEEGTGLWKQGWRGGGVPESIRGYKYKGVNNFLLTMIAMARGYSDNRWVTFNQMSNNEWTFKTDENGKSLGKRAGVGVEYFELRDRETKQPFDEKTLLGMSDDEKEEYKRENVYPLRKLYRVFNGDIIEGIPQKEVATLDESGKCERAENILEFWSDNESEIIYGGNRAFYSPKKDVIRVPNKEDFDSIQEFYGTTLHEIGHSTGHEKRLNRDLGEGFGSESYAKEELRAEIASMFISQELQIDMNESSIENNSAYLNSWKSAIQDDPNALFTAIAEADRITKFVMMKEKENAERKEVQPFSIVTEQNELGEDTYKLFMVDSSGEVIAPIDYAFSDREALVKEFEKLQKLPQWGDREFKEVDFDELKNASKKQSAKMNVAEEKSQVYSKPSALASKETAPKTAVNMQGRGEESLTKMSDREIVKKASETKKGDVFLSLYNGGSHLRNEEKDQRSLMTRLAMFTGKDKEQLIRIFQSSGQFNENKPQEFYEKMANQSIAFVGKIQKNTTNKTSGADKNRSARNSKT